MWTSCSVNIQAARKGQISTLCHCKLQIGCVAVVARTGEILCLSSVVSEIIRRLGKLALR